MQVTQAYRYELDPTVKQRISLAKHAGVARFTYNWGLSRRIKQFESQEGKEKFTSSIKQHKELNALKLEHFPWMYEVSKCAPLALKNLHLRYRESTAP